MMRQHIRPQYYIVFWIISLTWITRDLQAQSPQAWSPLGTAYSARDLRQILVSTDRWHPYPRYDDPGGFGEVPGYARQAIIREAEKYLGTRWAPLPASVFLEFSLSGNRAGYEMLSFARRRQLAVLVLAEAIERKGRFLDDIVNGIWAISEETFWGVPAHLSLQKRGPGLPDVQDPAVDLFAAETAQELAWTYYLLKPALDKVSPLVAQRIVYEEKRRILEPYLRHDDWGYQGFIWAKDPAHHGRVNNWNPWINANVLVTAALTAEDTALRTRVIHKTMESLDNFMIPYPLDGGSDEGPEYWEKAAGSVLDYLETLKGVTAGKIDVLSRPILRKMGEYIYKTHISGSYFFNYGDCDARLYPDPALLYRFGRDTRDTLLTHFGAAQAVRQNLKFQPLTQPFGILNHGLAQLMLLHTLATTSPVPPLERDVWFDKLQIMAARSRGGSSEGFYLGVKGGTNGESHNHNDVGSFIVYVDGKPALVDAGAQTYTRETFSRARYELWNNQSSYHNLPDINGYGEQAGSPYRASGVSYTVNDRSATLRLDIAQAYPKQAGVASWIRTVSLQRDAGVTLSEDYQLTEFLTPAVEHFLTPLACDISQKGIVLFKARARHGVIRLHYDAGRFTAAVDTIGINDGRPRTTASIQNSRTGRMYAMWGDHLYRLRLTARDHALRGRFLFTIDRF
jgi:hypothetical protein